MAISRLRHAARLTATLAAAAVAGAAASITFAGCRELMPTDVSSLLVPGFQRSEVVGFLAGLGTTFAAVPDLLAMFRHRSTAGMNPRMAAIMGVFQILWIYYGLLIASRPVIVWNIVAVLINFTTVAAYWRLRRHPSGPR